MIKKATQAQDFLAKAGNEIIYLVTCHLHGIKPQESQLEQIDLALLYQMAKKHGLRAMVCLALESTHLFSTCQDKELVKKWKDAKEKAIRKTLMLDAERREILSFMEKEGIWYLPLKGIILKDMYPKLGMREMADNDILYDKQAQKQLLKFMTARGYKACSVGKGNHDVYQKKPVYNFEFHTALYGLAHQPIWQGYYGDIKEKLIKDQGNSWGYHFRDEDFYVYITTHAYKHYKDSGTGLRSLLDVYIFLEQKRAILDWDYIEAELEKLEVRKFERESRVISKKIFSKKQEELTQEEWEIVRYYLESGTYGTMKNHLEKKFNIGGDHKSVTVAMKTNYYLKRLMPGMTYFKNHKPFIYEHKWMIPFFLIYRAVRGLIWNGKRIWREIKLVYKI